MKHLTALLCLFLLLSCQEKVVHLPDVPKSDLYEVTDLSPAYIFYDETLPDSVELNRKNLIISTHWIVNVDKRLTLKQAIPKIQELQDKRRNAQMHKNKDAKDYFSCNDTGKGTLGFMEFTPVTYHLEKPYDHYNKVSELHEVLIFVDVRRLDTFEISQSVGKADSILKTNSSNLLEEINSMAEHFESKMELVLSFNKNLTFQDYITVQSLLRELNPNSASISNQEFIY